jgi:hypothetical protein
MNLPLIPTRPKVFMFAVLCLWGGASASLAADAATLLSERGRLIYSDDLNSMPIPAWVSPKGKWESDNGALRGAEKPEDKHGAVNRHKEALGNAVIQFSAKLDGCKMVTLSINDAKGHLCRLLIRPDGFTLQKDDHDHDGPDKAAVFQVVKAPVETGKWHTFTLEMLGREMLASMDGQYVGFGAHEAIETPKADIGLTVAGQSACFKELKIWEALPNKGWDSTKERLKSEAPSRESEAQLFQKSKGAKGAKADKGV